MGNRRKATIYTDGAQSGHGGGWAAIVTVGDRTLRASGGHPDTTNNRMELAGAINGLKLLTKGSYDVTLYSDSRYIVNAFEMDWISSWKRNGWARSSGELANVELWQLLAELAGRHNVRWEWVKGHSGNPMNELADSLAVQERDSYNRGRGSRKITITDMDGTVIMQKDDWLPAYERQFCRDACAAEIIGGQPEQQSMFMIPESDDYEDTVDDVEPALAGEELPPQHEETVEQASPIETLPIEQSEAEHLAKLDVYSIQLLMEMAAVKETKLLHPCGQYEWCSMCKQSDTPCINAFLAYRATTL